MARRLDDGPTRALPLVLGTLVAQTALNVLALACLVGVTATSIDVAGEHPRALIGLVAAPAALLAVAGLSGPVLRSAWLTRLRAGLAVLRTPHLGAQALLLQVGAWAIQVLACFAVLRALGLDASTGLVGAAAVLLAVNVTAAVPVTPSNVGVFQAACVAVLAGGYGVDRADALAYGVCLQAVEIAAAIVMGVPALLGEGLTRGDLRGARGRLGVRPGASTMVQPPDRKDR